MRATFDPEISEWGNPALYSVIPHRIHRCGEQTQGTETSKYLEERTSTETPSVVASEGGPGQWRAFKNRNRLEKRALEGESPVRVERTRVLE